MSLQQYSHVRIVESSAANARLDAARDFVRSRMGARDILTAGASRAAADALATSLAAVTTATIGIHRSSLTDLAARLAAPVLAANRLAPATSLGSEAVAARAAFDARQSGALQYF